jgi:hypothetical protein
MSSIPNSNNVNFRYGNRVLTIDPHQTGVEYKKWGSLYTNYSRGDTQQRYKRSENYMIMNRLPFCNYPLREALPDCYERSGQFPSHVDQRGIKYENNKM